MCPSCEYRPINPLHGLCDVCTTMYSESLGPDWKTTEIGEYLTSSNLETARVNKRIAAEPTGHDIELVAGTTQEANVSAPKDAGVDDMIEALVVMHGWGYRRVHNFLSKGEYNLPSLSTMKRRVAAIREKKAA